jgi:hypothetical protein
MQRTDAVHGALMASAFGLAYLVPFELLLLSYVVLGPAHYLTEISWLHDRKYFVPHRGVALGLALIAVVAALIDNASWFGFVMWAAFIVCLLVAATSTAGEGAVLMMIATAVTLPMAISGQSLAVIGILLPTLVHVSLFTLVFMTLGACRSGSRAQAGLIAGYLVAITCILAVPPSAATGIPAFVQASQDYFGNVAPALGRLFGIPGLKLDSRLTGLLAFVYTYHYLNWFIKADVIRWYKIPRPRLALVAGASAAATALYFYDYGIGFLVLLALSLVHVVLEFPLNGLALRELGGLAGRGVKQMLQQRT